MPKKLTKEEFINKSVIVHGETYDYSKVEYKDNQQLVEIICPVHGSFWIPPCKHFKGRKCPACSGYKMNTIEFINRANKIHNNRYNYSLVNYAGVFNKVKIICSKHGEFEQTPDRHMNSNGCFLCGIETTSNKKTYNTFEFIKKAKNIHGNKYDYSLVEYKHSRDQVVILCPEHGEFKQTPNAHWAGKGCGRCRESKGEREIANILSKNNIIFETQKTFGQCKIKNYLPFDFYLPTLNVCIEFDGEQHYKIVDWFGGEEGFKTTQKNDKFKTKFCKKHKIKLIRIKYNQDIKDVVDDQIQLLTRKPPR
jgi:very-short-patch-repair endonuclease